MLDKELFGVYFCGTDHRIGLVKTDRPTAVGVLVVARGCPSTG